MKIQVTAEHIAKGEPGNLRSCPVALALAEKTQHPLVSDRTMSFYYKDKYKVMSIPEEARSFIAGFDAYMDVSPFEFELEGLE